MHLQVTQLSKAYGVQRVLQQVSFAVEASQFVCLLGPSGCGKTTLLRTIAGLVAPDEGSIRLGDADLTHTPTRQRGFGMVFQSYSLFPNLTVAQNIGYGMKLRRSPAAQIQSRVEALLEMVQLQPLAQRYPAELSGGQQQRVSLARALAVDPALLLLDEPLSALDARVRVQMRQLLHDLQRRLGVPTLMVTHDQDEALSLADIVVCMNAGRIEQIGSPQALYHTPTSRFVASFVGAANLLPTPWVSQAMPELLATHPTGAEAALEACMRPEDLRLHADPAGTGVVLDTRFFGSLMRLGVSYYARRLEVEQHRRCALQPGDAVRVEADASCCTWVRA